MTVVSGPFEQRPRGAWPSRCRLGAARFLFAPHDPPAPRPRPPARRSTGPRRFRLQPSNVGGRPTAPTSVLFGVDLFLQGANDGFRWRRITAQFRLHRPVFVDADWTFVDAPRPSVDRGATGPVSEYTGDCDAEQGIAMPRPVSRPARFPDGVARSHSAHCACLRNCALLLRLVPAAARRSSRLRTSGRPARRQNELRTVASRGPRPPCRLRSTPHLRHRRDVGGRFAPHADRHRWRNGRRPIVARRAADRPAGHRHPPRPAADAGRPGSYIQGGGTGATNPCRARDHCTVPTSATAWLR